MKNRAFTLLELIGVIVILALLILIVTPVINVVMKNSKEKLYNNTLDNIKLAAKNWTTDEDNIELLPKTDGNCLILSLKDLKDNGYIDLEIKDPRNNKPLNNDDTLVLITKSNANYDYDVITDGDIGSTNCYVELPDPTAPVISANATKEFIKNINLNISYTVDFGLSSSNVYEYYLSSSMNSLKDGNWTTYINGVSQNVGSNLNGTYYLFVKRISNLDEIKSLIGGVLVTINSESYQRFGPYKFDNTKPVWTFYGKTNTNNFSPTQYQNLIYAYDDDTVTITIRGNDDNYLSSNLDINDIGILINSVDYTDSLTKSLSTGRKIDNGIEYTLTISDITQKGNLSLRIESDTLTDKASNSNIETILNTGVIVNTCIYNNGQVWEYNYTKSSEEFKVPCKGTYKVELMGAQGGTSNGGAGASTSGNIYLTRKTIATVIVGGQGTSSGGYNGGGSGERSGGGGATDIRIGGSTPENRIMVAAGGGGGSTIDGTNILGGIGGTTTGGDGAAKSSSGTVHMCTSCTNAPEGKNIEKGSCSNTVALHGCIARIPTGGTQTQGGLYGIAWHVQPFTASWAAYSGTLGKGGNGMSGGGGGYYGGGGASIGPTTIMSAAGGSSCISGYSGCTNPTYTFTSPSWQQGIRAGNGYAKITLISAD